MQDFIHPVPDDAALSRIVDTLYERGFVAASRAFPTDQVDTVGEDVKIAFDEAIAREGGAVPRGPARWYVELHPEQLRGFVALATHPWVRAVCTSVLGPDYEIVEVGFDVPFPGAEIQPWHRDFPSTPETFRDRRITSLAFNLTTVDTTPEMGAFEIAPGTHWEEGPTFRRGMFPDRSEWPRYEAIAEGKLPQRGDISARSALAIHRGTANRSAHPRPVVVLGVDAPGAGHAALHDMLVTQAFYDTLPADLKRHLHARVVDRLVPIVQKHTIEGLLKPAY